MTHTELNNELQRRLELIAGKALGDLSGEEQADVDELLEETQWQTSLWQLEVTAAALDLRMSASNRVAMPTALAALVQQQAEGFFQNQEQSNTAVIDSASQLPGQLPGQLPPGAQAQPRVAEQGMTSSLDAPLPAAEPVWLQPKPHPVREWLGWICCAASLFLAVGIWASGETNSPSPSALRDSLLASATDALQVKWESGPSPFETPVSGDVVWSNNRQSGYMRFQGLPINNPSVEQYQLWIIDPDRDEQPIDGGVFDITANQEAIVAINAKLAVINPKAFAITIEKPGGVVVSDQQRLPLLASVP